MKIYKSKSNKTGIEYKSIYPFDQDKIEDFAQLFCMILVSIVFLAVFINLALNI